MEYKDYSMIIDDKLEVSVFSPGVPPEKGKFEIDKQEMEYAVGELEKETDSTIDRRFLKRVGTKLAASLFTTKIYKHFHSVKSKNVNYGLRIRLTIEAPELSDYPWETLFLDNKYLATSVETPLTRYFRYGIPTKRSFGKPVRILIIGSNPSALDLATVQVNREIENIKSALQEEVNNGSIKLDSINIGEVDRIMTHLNDEQYNVIHFIGHGIFKDAIGYLALEDTQGNIVMADHDWIGKIFQNQLSLGLLVINACQGAKLSTDRAFNGLASELVKMGIPSVIAMRYSISNPVARLFSKEFYRNLMRMPIDENMQRVRHQLYVHAETDRETDPKDFIIPVLFMNSPDGLIFSPENENAQELTQTPDCSARINELKKAWNALINYSDTTDEKDYWLLICGVYNDCRDSLDGRIKSEIEEMQTVIPVLLKSMDRAWSLDDEAGVNRKKSALIRNYQRLIRTIG